MGLFRVEPASKMTSKETIPAVQVYGRKKTATAVAHCKRGNGLIKVNGRLLEHIEPRTLQYKLMEPILLLGKQRFSNVTIRVRVKGGGHTSQVYAIRQAISKSLIAYYQKFVDEASKKEIKNILANYEVEDGALWYQLDLDGDGKLSVGEYEAFVNDAEARQYVKHIKAHRALELGKTTWNRTRISKGR